MISISRWLPLLSGLFLATLSSSAQAFVAPVRSENIRQHGNSYYLRREITLTEADWRGGCRRKLQSGRGQIRIETTVLTGTRCHVSGIDGEQTEILTITPGEVCRGKQTLPFPYPPTYQEGKCIVWEQVNF